MTEWLKQNPEVIYFETSALDGSNVNEAFSRIAQNFLKMQGSMDLSLNLPSSIGGSETPGAAGKKKFELK